jgi:hypothetical protein
MAELDREKWPLVLLGDGPLRSLIDYAIQRRFMESACSVLSMKNQGAPDEECALGRRTAEHARTLG